MYQIYRAGNAWCAVTDGFVNLQESIAGFGSDAVTALQNLLAILEDEEKSDVVKCGIGGAVIVILSLCEENSL